MAGKRVMIVDDSTIMRKVIEGVLKKQADLEVCALAKDGKDALDQLKTAKPDLILLDIEMPNMNGLQFLRYAKLKSKAKIIILSSVTDIGSPRAKEALKLGADSIVSKPSGAISMDLGAKVGQQLLAAIQNALS
jgi:chemotaxis response regulator CheB